MYHSLSSIHSQFEIYAKQDGDTPLHRFSRRGMPQAVASLLAHGADPNARNPRTGDTPLHVAGAWVVGGWDVGAFDSC